jgi:plastocyanin
MEQYKFAPPELKVKAGTTVKRTDNGKRASHPVPFSPKGSLASDRMMPGDSWLRTFVKPGRSRCICGAHPKMSGLVEVTE